MLADCATVDVDHLSIVVPPTVIPEGPKVVTFSSMVSFLTPSATAVHVPEGS